jgi:peptide/nickel transport system ATP-binding protein
MPLLDVRDLDVAYLTKKRPPIRAVNGASFTIEPGEIVGLVGESGSGKSTLGNAVLRLLQPPGAITGGEVIFEGKDLTKLSEDQLREMRWRDLSTVFQSSMNSLNPVLTIQAQFKDAIRAHQRMSDTAIRERTAELLRMVTIDPSFMRFYPHELSGGMKQRVNLAMALALEPTFVLLDEPTTGLDVIVQRSILQNLRAIQREQGFAVLFISHDLGTVMEVCDRVMVMYAGEIVEEQTTHEMLRAPQHPYTRGLLGSYADPKEMEVEISYIPGRPPDLSKPHQGCIFAPRCVDRIDLCWQQAPGYTHFPPAGRVTCHVASMWLQKPDGVGLPPRHAFESAVFEEHHEEQAAPAPVLAVERINKTYTRRRGLKTSTVNAVVDVSFTLERGQVTALVGQSGSGKSTIARLVTGIERPDSGTITMDGTIRVDQLSGRALRDYRSRVQYVFQDPFSALNPAHTIKDILSRPLRNYRNLSRGEIRAEVEAMLEQVGLSPPSQFIDKLPHQLSGGQRQRVVVARALAPQPEIIIADEPISMLDVSIRAEILQLLDELVKGKGISMLYITHDLLSARLLADDIIVLHHGRVVEQGDASHVITAPEHDYTQELLNAIPNPFAAD